VGPELKLHECGLPKEMALELFKPFIIRHLTERGIYSTPKTAKKRVEAKDPVIWEILEEIMKGHPVLLNRAPTLHRLGIQAFQPKLIEGRAIQLHPLVCTGFNADFDGDQMAVHVPLSNEACLEAMILMLSSHNLLHPANGTPITVPSQDMVLGLYYLTKEKPNAKGQGMTFSSPEEVLIAFNQNIVDLHAKIRLRLPKAKLPEEATSSIIETTVGRVLFNQHVPDEIPFVNELLTKKAIKNVIHQVIQKCGTARTAQFLDAIKELGFYWSFKGGLSFRLSDIIIPPEKWELIEKAKKEVQDLHLKENMGLLTRNERYNIVTDLWFNTSSKIRSRLLHLLEKSQDGFNPIYMMYHSGARGSDEQIRQLGGMRGLMAKPQKTLRGAPGEYIETPIYSSFKEGLTILEYFISTHGARKGLSDTALKTADAGYLTRRLADVAQDVVITEYDCGTLRGLKIEPIENEKGEIQINFSQLIVGRVALEDIYDPETDELICAANQELTEDIVKRIEKSGIRSVEIRSVLTCDATKGVCVLCYGRNLATGKMAEIGDAVGIMAAQSIGEPGTQLTLRTFHHGGTAQRKKEDTDIYAPRDSIVQFKGLKTIDGTDENGKPVKIVINGGGELLFLKKDNPERILDSRIVPYGAFLYISDGDEVKKGDQIGRHSPYERAHYAAVDGIVRLVDLEEGQTFRRERAEVTGKEEIVVIQSRDRRKTPTIYIYDLQEEKVLREYNVPVNARLLVKDGERVKPSTILFKTPINLTRSGDITGGLPRVQELFEARRPTDAAILSEIDGVVTIGKLKRSKRLVYVTTRDGAITREYQIPTEKHILVQDNDFVRAGQPLTDGMIDPMELLRIRGLAEVQQYVINQIQKVYREQDVTIDNKHVEVIVRQMMKKVRIVDPGDSIFLEGEEVEKYKFEEENNFLHDSYYIEDPGDSKRLKAGMLVKENELREERAELLRKGARLPIARRARPAIAQPLILGITRVSLSTESWISAASFQETPRVLSEAAIEAKTDYLQGLKENVVVGHLIPAGTGFREFLNIQVGTKEQLQRQIQGDGKEAETKTYDSKIETTKLS
jgi:DNA-directed RNA polymerase subunit beta'